MIESTYSDSDQAMRLCRVLNNPEADVFPIRLWAWGINTNRENGRFDADANQLAQIVRFRGDPPLLLLAFLECGIIEKTETPLTFRINGWKRNAKFFSERKRLKNKYKPKNARGNAAGMPEIPAKVSVPSSSSSSSSSLESPFPPFGGNLLNAASDDFDQRAELEPPDPRATKQPRSTRQEEQFAEAAWIAKEQARNLPGQPLDETGRRQMGGIIRAAIAGKTTYEKVFDEWFTDPWREAFGWSLLQLSKRIRDVINAMTDPKLRPKPRAKTASDKPEGYRWVPSVEETAARVEAERIANIRTPEKDAAADKLFDDMRAAGILPKKAGTR